MVEQEGLDIFLTLLTSLDDWRTIVSSVKAGNTNHYKVGDTKIVDLGTYGTHTIRVSNNQHVYSVLRTGRVAHSMANLSIGVSPVFRIN
jgi:hypothetical protein